jgi:sugar phosphate isomerase/epimerase
MKEQMLWSRRQLLACGLTGAAALSMLKPGFSLETGAKKRTGFGIGACDWNLGKQGNPESFEVAKKIGLDGVQVSMSPENPDLDLRNPKNLKAMLDASKATGVEIGSLALGCLNGTPYKSDPKTEKWVEDSVDVCLALGVKVALLAFFGAGDLVGDKAGRDEVVRRLKKVAPKAEKAGVVLGIESYLPAQELLEMVNAVNSPGVGVYYDVYTSLVKGYDIYAEIRELGKHICEFHAKDESEALLGQGKVDFKKVREAMDAIGYRGWIHLEAGTPLGLEESYRKDAEFLRTLFPAQLPKA